MSPEPVSRQSSFVPFVFVVFNFPFKARHTF